MKSIKRIMSITLILLLATTSLSMAAPKVVYYQLNGETIEADYEMALDNEHLNNDNRMLGAIQKGLQQADANFEKTWIKDSDGIIINWSEGLKEGYKAALENPKYHEEEAPEATKKVEEDGGVVDKEEVEEDLVVEEVSAINNTKLVIGKTEQLAPVALDTEGKEVEGVNFSFTSSNEDIVTVNEEGLLTAVALGEAEVTVTTTNAVENVEKVIKVEVVKEKEQIEMKISPEKLVADGKTIMEVTVTLNTPNADKMGGMITFNSKLGLKANKVEEALNKGVAKFNVQLPTHVKELNDTITVSVKSHDVVDGVEENELVGLSTKKHVVYKAMGTDGGGFQEIVRTYEVSSVKSMDMADRVAIYVGMENSIDLEDVKKSIINQVKLYNTEDQFTKDDQINIIKIEDVEEVKGGYAFISLIDLGEGKAKNVLHDNQYNYYSVERSTRVIGTDENNITLKTKPLSNDTKAEQRFMVIDGKRPEVRNVKATKNDGKFLPNDSILVEFNEPVNKLTAEDAANYTINGKNLKEFDAVKSIKLIDIEEAYPEEEAPKWTAIEEGKERNSVLIELKPSFARNEIRNAQNNLLQVKSIADWAGMTDLSDNNKISTQDFTFIYDVPEVKMVLNIKPQSPEQFVLTLGDDLYVDEDQNAKFNFKNAEIKVTLEGKDKDDKDFSKVITDYEIRNVEDNKYILELTQDWTVILDGTNINAYHGKAFKVSIVGNTYNVYGEQVTGHEISKDENNKAIKAKLDDEVELVEDTKSPYIEDHKVLTTKVEEKEVVNGNIQIEMNEPVQLVDKDGKVFTYPGLTPSLEQKVETGVPVPTFEYVQIKDKDGKESKGVRIAGEIVSLDDEYDMLFTVEPVKALEPGDWKLVVRSISDDVGNTMKTEQEIVFTIEGKAPVVTDMKVNPYLVWGYVVDDVNDAPTGKVLENDYVVLLFSREMDIDVLKSSTYSINGKALDQDAKITDTLIPVYKNIDVKDKLELHGKGRNKDKTNVEQWMAHLVTIELPKDFIVADKNKHALTLPTGLKAVDDKVEKTDDILLGGTQFELDFDRYGKLVGKDLLPAFDGSHTPKVNDMEDHKDAFIARLVGGEPVDPETPEEPGDKKATMKVLQENVLPGMDKVEVTLTGIDNPEDYEVSCEGRVFKYKDGVFVGVVKTTMTEEDLVIMEKTPVDEPGDKKATMKVLQENVLPGMDKVEVTLTGVDNPEDYEVSCEGRVFRYKDGVFVGVVKTIMTEEDLVITEK